MNHFLIHEKVSQFASGKEHILFLTSTSNQLYSFGIGTKGQLGLGKIENRYELTLVKPPSNNMVIKSISAGGWHSAFLDDKFDCYIWGWNLNGQVSECDDTNDSVFIVNPTRLVVMGELSGQPVKFKNISLGSRHSAILDRDGNLYTFGWNKYGQLFIEFPELDPDEDYNFEKPIRIDEFVGIGAVKCGCWLTAIFFV